MNLDRLNKDELLELYGNLVQELRRQNVIGSKNVVGDIGEYLAISYYSNTPGLPKLQFAPPSTENIDAISTKGERYSIKSTTNSTTGVFYGLNPPESDIPQRQLFEYVLIVVLNDNYQLQKIIQLDWQLFLKYKRWHSRMNAWHLTINKKLLSEASIIFSK